MWVLHKVPVDQTMEGGISLWPSPWKGCIHIDQEGRAWYATGLAKPTQFSFKEEAENCAETIRTSVSFPMLFPNLEIRVAVYEEIFPESLPIPTTQSITTVKNTTNIPDWNWDDGERVPF